MPLDPEELSMFDDPVPPAAAKPAPEAPGDWFEDPAEDGSGGTTKTPVVEAKAEPLASVLPPDAPPNDPNAVKEKRAARAKKVQADHEAKEKKTDAPACGACGKHLNKANASQLSDGSWKHIGCSGPAPVVVPPGEYTPEQLRARLSEAVPTQAKPAEDKVAKATALLDQVLKAGEERKNNPPSHVIIHEIGPRAAEVLTALVKALSK